MPLSRRTLLTLGAAGVLAGCAADLVSRPAEAERIAYGEDPSQYAELTRPDGDPRGVVVIIHGGFWKSTYDLSLGRPLVPSLLTAGWATWNLEYRRVGPGAGAGGGGGVPATLDDVAAGLDALAGVRDLDLATVVTVGHSAGGHLATWAAARGRFGFPAQVPVTAVVSQAGVLDLRSAYAAGLGGGAVEAFLGHPPGPGDAGADPIQQVPLDVPVWCVHGRGDTTVPLSQSEDYVAAARKAGARAELISVEGDHFAVIDPASVAWQRTLELLP